MTVVFSDGFDTYAATAGNGSGQVGSRWVPVSSYSNSSITTGRFAGSRAFNAGASFTTGIIGTFPNSAAPSTFAAGVAVRFSGGIPASAHFFWLFASAGTYQIGLQMSSTGFISVYKMTSATAGTLLGTASTGLTLSTALWHYIELECTISDTVGTIDLYLNGANVLSLTGQDTRNGTPTTINQVIVGPTSGTSNWLGCLFDDLYVTDSAARLGEQMVELLSPNANATVAMTPSTGTNYTCVDGQFASGAYVEGDTVGEKDLYDLPSLSSTPAAINCVTTYLQALKSGAGARSVTTVVKSGASETDGPNLAIAGGGYLGQFRHIAVDPNTGVAWTNAAITALQIGAKVTV